MVNATEAQSVSFDDLPLAPQMKEILRSYKFVTPTPIQIKAIPVAMTGGDVIGIAQTGTGKTLAFGLPMIERLARHKGRGLVILPTRELALQVEEELNKLGSKLGMKTVVLIGGANMGKQIRDLKAKPHVIVCTPGRLIDHMEQKTLSLADVKILVLDEADRMLDMGFAPQLARIMTAVPKDRQTLLFSATMPQDIVTIANKHMKTPVRIEVAQQGTASERVSQELIIVHKAEKLSLLKTILSEYKGTILVFSRTKHGAKKICAAVKVMGHTSAELHANKSLSQRREALEGFKIGRYRVLIATDIAARGIDVKGIELVINYDLPDASEDYVHRIGRTGRAGKEGKAISFATPDQTTDVRSIERLIRMKLPVSKRTGLTRIEFPAGSDDRYPSHGARPFSGPRAGSGSSAIKPYSKYRAQGSSSSRPAARTPYVGKSYPVPAPSAFGAPKVASTSEYSTPAPRPATSSRPPFKKDGFKGRSGAKGKARGFRKYEPAERFDKDDSAPATGQYSFKTTI
ncbi:MAG: DEAD/DEAH box helicase [Patescibacteria group bacterium]|jgi:ATP-dependent RNA helicase RhlE